MESQEAVDSLVPVTDVKCAVAAAIVRRNATLTLHHFTLDALTSDASKEVIGGEDAIAVVFELVCFVHTVSMAWIGAEVKRWWTLS